MQLLIDYAMRMVGNHYQWGGSNPLTGMDCSGLVQELLSTAGIDPVGDQTAQGLYNYFEKNGSYNKYGAGALAFYGQSTTKISHIAFCVDQYRIIEAGGGGSTTTSIEAAAKQNAFIRMRLINNRKDLQAVIMPSYVKIGKM
jgi:cell wall-associated NlpC family hydrolase